MGETSMDLTTIIEIGLMSGASAAVAGWIVLSLVIRRLWAIFPTFIDEKVAEFVTRVQKDDEFRTSLIRPLMETAMKELGVQKDRSSTQKLKIGGFSIPASLIETFLPLITGAGGKKAAELVGGSLLG